MLHDILDSQVAAPSAGSSSLHDMMAGVGYLMFQWSLLDASLNEEIGQLRRASGDAIGAPGRTRSLNERLAEWRAMLSRGRRRRADHYDTLDRITAKIQEYQRRHALLAAGFATAPAAAAPAIRFTHAAERGGAAKGIEMTLSDIHEMIDQMELCRSEMALLRGLCEH